MRVRFVVPLLALSCLTGELFAQGDSGSVVTRRVGQKIAVSVEFAEPPPVALSEARWKFMWDPEVLGLEKIIPEGNPNGSASMQWCSDNKSACVHWTAPSDVPPADYAPSYQAVFSCLSVPTDTDALTAVTCIIYGVMDINGEEIRTVESDNPDRVEIVLTRVKFRVRIREYVEQADPPQPIPVIPPATEGV